METAKTEMGKQLVRTENLLVARVGLLCCGIPMGGNILNESAELNAHRHLVASPWEKNRPEASWSAAALP
jgi:hypothetical protein